MPTLDRYTAVDQAVIDAYRSRDDSVDDILTDPSEATKFVQAVNNKLPAGRPVDDRTILRRLITLRKRGKGHGGLPRGQGRPAKPR